MVAGLRFRTRDQHRSGLPFIRRSSQASGRLLPVALINPSAQYKSFFPWSASFSCTASPGACSVVGSPCGRLRHGLSIRPSCTTGVLLLTEALFTTLVLAACVCAAEAVRSRERTVWFAIACGVCVGLAALTRSVLWPYPIFLAPLVAFLSSGRWHQRAAAGAALFAAYVAVVAPWAVRNTRLQKTFIVVDTMGGMNLRMGNFEHTIEDRMWDGVSLRGEQSWSHQMIVEHPEARRWTEGERDRWARQRATEYIRTHPGTTLRRSVRKFADFWGLEREYIAALQKGTYPCRRGRRRCPPVPCWHRKS